MLFQIENVNATLVVPILTLLVLDRVERFLQATEQAFLSVMAVHFSAQRDTLLSTAKIHVNMNNVSLTFFPLYFSLFILEP